MASRQVPFFPLCAKKKSKAFLFDQDSPLQEDQEVVTSFIYKHVCCGVPKCWDLGEGECNAWKEMAPTRLQLGKVIAMNRVTNKLKESRFSGNILCLQ